MRISPKILVLLLYIFLFLLVFSQVFAQIPINEITLPYVVLTTLLLVVGLVFILGWDYIVPMIIRSFRLGECYVREKKYIVCRYRGTAEYTGYAVLKIVPSMPIADMPKERRESMLQAIQGLLRGAQYEVIVSYIGMRDRYHDNIIKRLEAEKQRLMAFTFKETPSVRETMRRIDTELQILRQVPMILEGFYIAMVREYGNDENDVITKLEADSRALATTLESLSAEVKIIEGEELKNIVSYLLFGSVVQLSI